MSKKARLRPHFKKEDGSTFTIFIDYNEGSWVAKSLC